MNKKGSAIGILIFVVSMVLAIWFTISLVNSESGVDCKHRSNSILKSVNGVEDIDTGFLSGGTIREKTLMFNDGLVATFKQNELRNIELIIGNTYKIERCQNNGGRIWYNIERTYTMERDALVSEGEQDG